MSNESAAEEVSRSARWDRRLEVSDLRKRANSQWGPDAQINKAAEELSELVACLNRHQNGQQTHDELREEFIDARIMLWQLELLFLEGDLEAELDRALDDLRERLEVFPDA